MALKSVRFLSWWNFSSLPTFHSFQVHPFPPLLTALSTQVSVLLLDRITTFSPLQNPSNFSPYRGSSRQLYHPSEVEILSVKQAGGRGPWSQKKMNNGPLCVLPCCTAAHRARIHFLQRHCHKAHFRNVLKCSSQTSVFQQVCLRSGETSLGHDKQNTDFEVFLTYVSSISLFVFCEVESKGEMTAVWLWHESLEKERISWKRHCS